MTSGISPGRRGVLSTSARRPELTFCSAELDLPATLGHQTVAHSAAVLETSCRSAGFTGKKEAFHHKAALEGANYGQWEGKRAFIKSENSSFRRPSFCPDFPMEAFVWAGSRHFSSAQPGAWPKQVRRSWRGSHLQSAACRRSRGGSG